MSASSTELARLAAIPSRRPGSWALPVALAVATVGLCLVIAYCWHYYSLPWEARFDAPLHRGLRSSGSVGHLYGYIGLALIVGNLLYLARRRLVNVRWLGSMRAWMDWHVFSGLVGPAFVLLHSAFTLRTWPAVVSSASLAIVVLTGLFGRYLYRLVPRFSDGTQEPADQLAAEVDHALMALRGLGRGAPQAADLVERRVDAAVAKAGTSRTGVGAIISALRALWSLRDLRPAARTVAAEAGASVEAAQQISRAAAQIGRLIVRVDLLETLGRAATFWRGLHRNLVLVMLLAASLHVSIAVYLGFL